MNESCLHVFLSYFMNQRCRFTKVLFKIIIWTFVQLGLIQRRRLFSERLAELHTKKIDFCTLDALIHKKIEARDKCRYSAGILV